MGQFKTDALMGQAEAVAAKALSDLEEVGGEVAVLAKKALSLQIVAASQKLLGIDTSFIEKSVAAAYKNLTVVASVATARKVQSVFRDIAGIAVDSLWAAAGLPEVQPQARLGDPEE